MLTVAGSVQIFVCTEPADMRRSFDGLCGMARDLMKQDPLGGHLFLFRNRNRDRLKILYWDRDGLAIWYKRLEKGTWQFPGDVKSTSGDRIVTSASAKDDSRVASGRESVSCEITREELSLLLDGIDLRSVRRRQRYQKTSK